MGVGVGGAGNGPDDCSADEDAGDSAGDDNGRDNGNSARNVHAGVAACALCDSPFGADRPVLVPGRGWAHRSCAEVQCPGYAAPRARLPPARFAPSLRGTSHLQRRTGEERYIAPMTRPQVRSPLARGAVVGHGRRREAWAKAAHPMPQNTAQVLGYASPACKGCGLTCPTAVVGWWSPPASQSRPATRPSSSCHAMGGQGAQFLGVAATQKPPSLLASGESLPDGGQHHLHCPTGSFAVSIVTDPTWTPW